MSNDPELPGKVTSQLTKPAGIGAAGALKDNKNRTRLALAPPMRCILFLLCFHLRKASLVCINTLVDISHFRLADNKTPYTSRQSLVHSVLLRRFSILPPRGIRGQCSQFHWGCWRSLVRSTPQPP